MALVVLEASIIIGFLDPEDALHAVSVNALSERQQDDLVAPASVYAEILVAPYRAGPDAVAEVESFLSDFAVRIEPITEEIARIAAALRSKRKGLRLPDAFVLATADEIDADVVLTADESWAYDTPEEAARGDIPERYARVVRVDHSSDGTRAVVLLATNEPPVIEYYGVSCELEDGRWFGVDGWTAERIGAGQTVDERLL